MFGSTYAYTASKYEINVKNIYFVFIFIVLIIIYYFIASEELSVGNIKLTTFDLGSYSQARKVWKNYFPAVDAIVFLVDACDKHRILKSKAELDSLLLDESTSNCPIFILGNRIDRKGALNEQELRFYLALNPRTGKVCMFLCIIK